MACAKPGNGTEIIALSAAAGIQLWMEWLHFLSYLHLLALEIPNFYMLGRTYKDLVLLTRRIILSFI